jgi:hypothetical protein
MTVIINTQPLLSPNSGPQPIDLVAFIEDAIPQVAGSDERRLLDEWLSRLTGPQVVRLALGRYLLQSVHSPNPYSKKEQYPCPKN